ESCCSRNPQRGEARTAGSALSGVDTRSRRVPFQTVHLLRRARDRIEIRGRLGKVIRSESYQRGGVTHQGVAGSWCGTTREAQHGAEHRQETRARLASDIGQPLGLAPVSGEPLPQVHELPHQLVLELAAEVLTP